MAGHSQFKNIMHKKGRADKARSKLFSKLAREITVSAKLGLPDPAFNPRLRAAILAAKTENMPKDNIERAVKKSQGGDTENYDAIRYEGYAPGGVAVIVEALTDNRNRTAGEVRAIFAKNGGNLAETGAVSFMFSHVGVVEFDAGVASADVMLEAAIEAGAHKVRINPGNIGGAKKVKAVVDCARDCGVPIRIGVNAGSLEKDILKKYNGAAPEGMVESALRHIEMLRSLDFHAIKVSLKASDVGRTVAAYRQLSGRTDLPLHLGVTEAGTLFSGLVKSALGIGMLLAEGIGDTLRVSLTRDPVEEVRAGFEILRALDIRQRGPEIIACPTCGRASRPCSRRACSSTRAPSSS